MWIFTNKGMLSVVKDRNKKGDLLVRARERKHLAAFFPKAKIIQLKAADYEFRVSVRRYVVMNAVIDAMINIDYDNFKNSIVDSEYHDRCYGVWTVFREDVSELWPHLGFKKFKGGRCVAEY